MDHLTRNQGGDSNPLCQRQKLRQALCCHVLPALFVPLLPSIAYRNLDVGIWKDLDHVQARRCRKHGALVQYCSRLLRLLFEPARGGTCPRRSICEVEEAQQVYPAQDLRMTKTSPNLRSLYSLALGARRIPVEPCDGSHESFK